MKQCLHSKKAKGKQWKQFTDRTVAAVSVSSYFTKHSGSSKVSGTVEVLAFDLQTMNNTLEDLTVCDCV